MKGNNMDTDFDIEVYQEESVKDSTAQLPVNFIKIGEVENDDVKIYIKQNVYSSLEKYSHADVQHERGTILIGNYHQELGKMHIVITDFIEAKYTDASASTLTFTHETWDYVSKEHEGKYPDKKIIGWQHTHPNYGVFLSNYDVFIHENFFNLPFQVAYVIDPVQNIRGFFQWKNGKIEKIKGYFVYDEPGNRINIEKEKENSSKFFPPKVGKQYVNIVVCLLAAAVLILSALMISQNQKFSKRFSAQEEELRNLSEAAALLEEKNTTVQSDNQIENQVADEPTAPEPSFDTVSFVRYTVEQGDTIYTICAKYNISYNDNYALIVGINGLKNPDSIYIGQQLMIPLD